jgi:urease accessory protein
MNSLNIIHGAITTPNRNLQAIDLVVDRLTLAKYRWRSIAADGRDFGFDLEHPLRHGDVFYQTATHQYRIAQMPENVLRVALTTPAQAASLAWQVGNLHFRVMIQEGFLLVEDDLALRQMFEREGVAFTPARAIFQPLAGSAGHHQHHHH